MDTLLHVLHIVDEFIGRFDTFAPTILYHDLPKKQLQVLFLSLVRSFNGNDR